MRWGIADAPSPCSQARVFVFIRSSKFFTQKSGRPVEGYPVQDMAFSKSMANLCFVIFLTRSTQSSLRFLFFLRVRLPSFFEGGALGGSCSDLEKTMPCRKSTLHKNPNIAYNQPVQQGTSISLYVPFRSRLAYGRNRSNPMERRHPSCINMN